MKKLFFFALVGLLPAAVCAQRLVDSVDPTIGTGDHGHVFVGANVPHGMVNAGPTQLKTGWDWCSGYHASGDSIVGFAQMHLSGTGCSDLGDIALMPSMGDVETSRQGLASAFSHDREEVRPGYYAVVLDRDNIKCEITATQRVALHRYTFPRGNNNARITIDLENGVGDSRQESRIYQVDEFTLSGFRISRGWAREQHVYFQIQFSKPIHYFLSASPSSPYAQATFEVLPGEAVMAKVSLSPTSEMAARNNRMAEMPTWDFKAIRQQAEDAWEKELGRIRATFRTERERRIFYTAMYHLMVAPSVWNDVCGDYRGSDGRVHHDAPHQNYTTWSLWDTYRSAHPLATLILHDRMADYAETMMRIWEEQGELPVWHLMSNETYCMVGCPAVPVLADMLLKGFIPEKDQLRAFTAMKESLMKQNRQLDWMQRLGYVPYDHADESVAKSLEYFLADWSAAQAAGRVGLKDDSLYFAQRSQGYRRLFDPAAQCMRALGSDGKFRDEPNFNPCHQTRDYTEGNPWQYTWLVPHDVHGLVSCFPSEQAFINRLDALFEADSDLGEYANPDITGLIGQYAHGNEPSHHTLYIYNYVGQPWKTARRVRQVMSELYDDKPAGLCGNEDVGQMSAWYILSAMGLYQVKPCGGEYVLGSPIVEQAELRVGENATFVIRTHNNSDENMYVKSVKLNGKPYPYSYLRYADMARGGTLDFYMTNKPSKWGTEPKYRP
ncbi:MAG: glycoside hydrolase family 92 protein [Bacteroidaceae bacterium]|nr:glycoside hydrolase family 92 protein [Bacteroidaceae bacterium]